MARKKLTKKKLVELLNKFYADDDIVYVIESNKSISPVRGVREETRTIGDWDYWEVLENGKWIKFDERWSPVNCGYRPEDCRRVNYREWQETKKCLVV